jgi:hypothetical protein
MKRSLYVCASERATLRNVTLTLLLGFGPCVFKVIRRSQVVTAHVLAVFSPAADVGSIRSLDAIVVAVTPQSA